MTHPYKTEPFRHQRSEFDATKDRPFWGLWWEMGVAKTKVLIDTAAHLWLHGKIDGLIIMGPEGVHTQWIDDEIPLHMPLLVQDSLDTFIWHTSKSGNKSFEKRWDEFLARERSRGLSVIAMTYHSLMTEKGAQCLKKFIKGRRCMLVLDESTAIKTPGTKTTKRVRAMAKLAPFRRLANGTPISDSPFNAYSQIRALNESAWAHLGITDSAGFRTYFGVFKRVNLDEGRGHFDQLVAYKNLDEMAKVVAAHGSRLLKADVFPDLPPKLYSKHYFELTPKQRAAYNDLKEEFRHWLSSGELVTAELAIVRMTRLQQITSGYLPADNEEEPTCLVEPEDNPRLHLLQEVLEEVPGKVIIWGKYDIDVDLIARVCREKLKWDVVTWDGRTSQEDKRTAKSRFLDPKGPRAFISKASSSAARGLNLQVANTVVYYNNSFVLDDRLQSEDRAHRPGIHHPVKYIDLIGKGTIDTHIVATLREKREIAAKVTGDQLASWL